MAKRVAVIGVMAAASCCLLGEVAFGQGAVNTTGSATEVAPGAPSGTAGTRERGNTVGSAAGVSNGSKGPASGDIDTPSIGGIGAAGNRRAPN